MQPTTMPDIKELEKNTTTITTPEEPKSLAEVAGEVLPNEQQPNVTPTDTSVETPKQAN